MALTAEEVIVELEAKVHGYIRDVDRARASFDRNMAQMERSARRTETSVAGAFRGIRSAAGTLAGIWAAAQSARGAQQLIDTSTRIENSLKVAGLAGEDLKKVYDELFASAQRNYAPVESLVQLYSRASLVQKELNVSTEELLGFTDKIGLALRVQGGDASQAAGALLQLSQALGGGTVRAEEFNSIQEGALPILQAVAAGLEEAGGSVSKLRQLVIDGKISSEVFFRAFEAGAPMLEEKVADAEATVSQRLINLMNVLVDTAGEFNDATGASEKLGTAIEDLATFIDELDFENIVTQVTAVINALNDGITAVQNFGFALGNLSGLDRIGSMIYTSKPNWLGSYSTRDVQTRVDEAFQGGNQNNGPLTPEAIRAAMEGREPATVLPTVEVSRGGRSGGRSTISVDDYAPPTSNKTGGRGRGSKRTPEEDWQRTIDSIVRQTEAIKGETEALRTLDPVMSNYEEQLERIKTEQQLLSEAKEAGVAITPELRKQIGELATQYAAASAAALALADSQEEIREKAEEIAQFNKDLVGGFAKDLLAGASAADALSNALSKVADKLLNEVLDAIFKVNDAGGGGGGFLSSIFGGIFGGGGFKANTTLGALIGAPGRANGGPVQAGQPFIVGERRPELFVPSTSGTIVPNLDKIGSGGSVSVPISIAIDATGADAAGLARVQGQLEQLKSELPARITQQVRQIPRDRVKAY